MTMPQNIKVAVLGIRGFPNVQGGPEIHAQNLYPLVAKRGCDVTVFTREGYVDSGLKEYKGVRLALLPCLRNKFLEAFLHTLYGVFAARKISPDILHIHAVGPSIFIPLAKLLGMRTVMTNHGPDYMRKKWGAFAKAVLWSGEYAGSRWADGVICVSHLVADDIKRRFRREVNFIPNGVNAVSEIKNTGILARHGLVKGKYVMAIGRFVPEKGFHDLIDAFNISGIHGWKLVIVGDATHEDGYTSGLKKMAGDDIILTGVVSGASLEELYGGAGLFVMPSYYEALSIALLEAMSHGLKCVVSDIPANKSVGLPVERYFKTGDVKELSEKIRESISSPLSESERAAQIGMVAEKYDWERIADQTLSVYKKVLSG
jgi:glycosyltransferase involved in cell wall biosynthesis